MGTEDLWLSVVFSLILLAASVVMLLSHLRTWRHSQEQPLDERKHDYRRRQFRRRMQTTAMLAVLAVAIFLGHWITSPPFSWWLPPVYWGATGLIVVWMMLLAFADMVLTRLHFRRLSDSYTVERARLQLELRRLQCREGNGRAGSSSEPPGDDSD